MHHLSRPVAVAVDAGSRHETAGINLVRFERSGHAVWRSSVAGLRCSPTGVFCGDAPVLWFAALRALIAEGAAGPRESPASPDPPRTTELDADRGPGTRDRHDRVRRHVRRRRRAGHRRLGGAGQRSAAADPVAGEQALRRMDDPTHLGRTRCRVGGSTGRGAARRRRSRGALVFASGGGGHRRHAAWC